MPMLVSEDSVINQHSLDWLAKTLSPAEEKRHYLGKMIRANGRISLIRKIAPNIKIIFVIRNPVDVLNSVAQMFSFYGSEFYESDFDRFAAEVAFRFGRNIQSGSDDLSGIKTEYAFWYYSNRAFLEFATRNPQNILTIAYEAFVENRSSVVSRICDFVGIDFNPDYSKAAEENLGVVQQNHSALTQAELISLQSKVSVYKGLLEQVSVIPSVPVDMLIRTNQWSEIQHIDRTSQSLNTLDARIQLRDKNSQLLQKEIQLEDLQMKYSLALGEISKILASKRYRSAKWILTPLDKLRKLRMK
jgi:hypothetical protein